MPMPVKRTQLNVRRRREVARESLRAEILAVSREIIAKEGFAALTMRKLAERIGYSPAALYLHFRSREEIARQVSLEGYADLLAEMERELSLAKDDAVARLRAIARVYIGFGLKNPQTYALIFMEDPAFVKAVYADRKKDDPGTRAYGLLLQTAAGLIDAGLRPPRVSPKSGKPPRAVTSVELAEAIWAALHGAVSLKLTCSAFQTSSAEVLTGVLVETMIAGLGIARR